MPRVTSLSESMEAVVFVVRSKVAILVAVVSILVLVAKPSARVGVVPFVDVAPRRVGFSGFLCNIAKTT